MPNLPDAMFDHAALRINADLVVLRMVADTVDDVVGRLSDIFIAQGYVKPSYKLSALEREKTCPTGLPTPGLGTAIPHGGVEHTLKPGIAIATLAHPVEFGELGNPDRRVKVSIVFLLSVTRPNEQVYLLQSIMNVYKDAASLRRLYAATDPDDIVQQVNAALAHSKIYRTP